jgi:hypothetical protein
LTERTDRNQSPQGGTQTDSKVGDSTRKGSFRSLYVRRRSGRRGSGGLGVQEVPPVRASLQSPCLRLRTLLQPCQGFSSSALPRSTGTHTGTPLVLCTSERSEEREERVSYYMVCLGKEIVVLLLAGVRC